MQFQIVYVGDFGNQTIYKWDHYGDRAATVEVLRQGHMDEWYGEPGTATGYEEVIAANDKAIQQFANSEDRLCQIVVPFGTVVVLSS